MKATDKIGEKKRLELYRVIGLVIGGKESSLLSNIVKARSWIGFTGAAQVIVLERLLTSEFVKKYMETYPKLWDMDRFRRDVLPWQWSSSW